MSWSSLRFNINLMLLSLGIPWKLSQLKFPNLQYEELPFPIESIQFS